MNPNQAGARVWWHHWWKVVAVGALAIFVGLATLGGVYVILRPLALIILSVAIAAAVAQLVVRLKKYMPRWAAVALIYLSILVLVVALGALILPNVISDLSNFIDRIPQMLERLENTARRYGLLADGENLGQLTSQLQEAGSIFLTANRAIFLGFFDLVLVFVFSVYMVLVAPAARKFLLSLVPEDQDDSVADVLTDMLEDSGGYVWGAFVNGLIVGVVVYIGTTIIGLPNTLLLALFAGVLELIPILGTILTTIVITIVALLQSVTTGLITFVFLLILQQIQGNFISPAVMHKQTHTPAVLVLLAVFIGGAVGGVVGALAALPLVVMLVTLVRRVIAPWIRQQSGAVHEPIPAPPEDEE